MATIVDCLSESAKSLGLILKPGLFRVSLSVFGRERCFVYPTNWFWKQYVFPSTFGGVVQFLVVCPLVAIMEDQVKDAVSVRMGLFTGCMHFV